MGTIVLLVGCAAISVLLVYFTVRVPEWFGVYQTAPGQTGRGNRPTIQGGREVLAVAVYDPFVPAVCLVSKRVTPVTVRIAVR